MKLKITPTTTSEEEIEKVVYALEAMKSQFAKKSKTINFNWVIDQGEDGSAFLIDLNYPLENRASNFTIKRNIIKTMTQTVSKEIVIEEIKVRP